MIQPDYSHQSFKLVKTTFNLEKYSQNEMSLNYKASPVKIFVEQNTENSNLENLSQDMIMHSPIKFKYSKREDFNFDTPQSTKQSIVLTRTRTPKSSKKHELEKQFKRNMVLFERAKVEVLILGFDLPKSNRNYISMNEEVKFMNSLMRTEPEMYCKYVSCKIYHFVLKFYKI